MSVKFNFDTLGSAAACTAEYSRLKAENARLRAALEAAPDPEPYDNGNMQWDGFSAFAHWYDGLRAKALKGDK